MPICAAAQTGSPFRCLGMFLRIERQDKILCQNIILVNIRNYIINNNLGPIILYVIETGTPVAVSIQFSVIRVHT
jgi:hypothetical protein